MVASAHNNFTEMMNMGLRLEEGAREGWLIEGSSSDGSREYGNNLPKKKEHDANIISQEGQRKLLRNSQRHQQVALVTLVINSTSVAQATLSYQPCFQQRANQQNQQNGTQRHVQFDPIPMNYTELFSALIQKILVQTRTLSVVRKELSRWY